MNDLQNIISKILQENIERVSIFITDELIEQIVERTLDISNYKETKYIEIKNQVRDELRKFINKAENVT